MPITLHANNPRFSSSQAIANDTYIWQYRQVKRWRFPSRQNNELHLPNERKRQRLDQDVVREVWWTSL